MSAREWIGVGACLVAAWALAGCDSGSNECACQPTGLRVDVCAALADQVDTFTLTGSACSASKAALLADASVDGGGAAYDIQPTQAGQCTVAVSFKNGLSFTAFGEPSPLYITQGPGCCTGLYPDPLSAADLQVCPEADASTDAEMPRDSAPGS